MSQSQSAIEPPAPSPLTTLTEDETMFRSSVREFAEGELRPRVEHMDEVAKLDGNEDVGELVRRGVDEINESLAHFQQVRRYEILDRDFSPERNEITPTLKLKRRVVEENFADELEGLYAD